MKKRLITLSAVLVLTLMLALLSGCGHQTKIDEAYIKNNTLHVSFTNSTELKDKFKLRVMFENTGDKLDGKVIHNQKLGDSISEIKYFEAGTHEVDIALGLATYRGENENGRTIRLNGKEISEYDNFKVTESDIRDAFGEDVKVHLALFYDNRVMDSCEVPFK